MYQPTCVSGIPTTIVQICEPSQEIIPIFLWMPRNMLEKIHFISTNYHRSPLNHTTIEPFILLIPYLQYHSPSPSWFRLVVAKLIQWFCQIGAEAVWCTLSKYYLHFFFLLPTIALIKKHVMVITALW